MLTWKHAVTPTGNWIWWTKLSNGWTAWVMDLSSRYDRPTEYISSVSVDVNGPNSKSLVIRGPIPEFSEAKRAAIRLALKQPPFVDRTFRISTER